jgi:hypothetical protein
MEVNPMADREGRGEANRGDTHAAPMVDDTNMSTHDANETAAADTVAEDAGEGTAEGGFMHAPIANPGQVATPAGSYTVLAGSGVAGGADIYPVDVDPAGGSDTTGNDIRPEQRGLRSGQDQDLRDGNDRDLVD